MALIIRDSVGRRSANQRNDVIAVKARLIELGFHWLTLDALMDSKTINAIRLFQAIKNGLHPSNPTLNDGCIDVAGDTQHWLNAVNAPQWQVAPLGSWQEGFVTIALFEPQDVYSFGTNWLFEMLRAAGKQYHADYLSKNHNSVPLTLNEISPRYGGITPKHKGHESGLACNLQLPSSGGSAGGITYSDVIYDQNAMCAMLTVLRSQSQVTNIFFNDPDLVAMGLCTVLAGHDNHVHVEIQPPAREDALF